MAMTGMIWTGGCAIIVTCPVGTRLNWTLAMTCGDGSCPRLKTSRWAAPAAGRQLRALGGTPSAGVTVTNGPGGRAGTNDEDAASCHAARAAPWLNGRPNAPVAVAATARDSMLRAASGAKAGLTGSYGGRS